MRISARVTSDVVTSQKIEFKSNFAKLTSFLLEKKTLLGKNPNITQLTWNWETATRGDNVTHPDRYEKTANTDATCTLLFVTATPQNHWIK